MMTPQDNEWTGQWVADKISEHDDVATAFPLSPQHVEVVRKKYGSLVIGTLAVLRLDANAVAPLLTGPPVVSFIVNVPREAFVTGDALELAGRHNVPIGRVGDLMKAVSLPDVRQYVNKEVHFVQRALDQHSGVAGHKRLDEHRYLVTTRRSKELVVVFIDAYELTADHVRTARERYGEFDTLVITNPYGGTTYSALNAAQSMSVIIYMWSEFLGALNRC